MKQNISAVGKPEKPLTPPEIAAILFDLKRKVLLWADRDMLMWWLELTENADDKNTSPVEAILKVDRLIRLMREELGKDNAGIEPGDLMSLFLIGGRDELRKASMGKS